MSCAESADRKEWNAAFCIIMNRESSRQIIDNRSRQRYLANRGIHSLSVRVTPFGSRRTRLLAAAIDLMVPLVHPVDDH
jgi:hypothetical protein